jgi:hypothetical protein
VNIQNYGLLNPKPSDPAGYVTKDGMWAAVPYGNNKFVIIHNGQQVHTANSYSSAKNFIQKQIDAKKKKRSSNLYKFL